MDEEVHCQSQRRGWEVFLDRPRLVGPSRDLFHLPGLGVWEIATQPLTFWKGHLREL